MCSPGIERELTRHFHFESSVGKTVRIKLYNAADGKKELTGVLKSADGDIIIESDGREYVFALKEISKATLCDQ